MTQNSPALLRTIGNHRRGETASGTTTTMMTVTTMTVTNRQRVMKARGVIFKNVVIISEMSRFQGTTRSRSPSRMKS